MDWKIDVWKAGLLVEQRSGVLSAGASTSESWPVTDSTFIYRAYLQFSDGAVMLWSNIIEVRAAPLMVRVAIFEAIGLNDIDCKFIGLSIYKFNTTSSSNPKFFDAGTGIPIGSGLSYIGDAPPVLGWSAGLDKDEWTDIDPNIQQPCVWGVNYSMC